MLGTRLPLLPSVCRPNSLCFLESSSKWTAHRHSVLEVKHLTSASYLMLSLSLGKKPRTCKGLGAEVVALWELSWALGGEPIVYHWDKAQLGGEFKLLPQKVIVKNFFVICDETSLWCANLRRKIVAGRKINRTCSTKVMSNLLVQVWRSYHITSLRAGHTWAILKWAQVYL